MPEILRFEPFNSAVEPEFWAGLADHKLRSAQLDTARIWISGEYIGGRRHTVRGNDSHQAEASSQRVAVPARLRVDPATWTPTEKGGSAVSSVSGGVRVQGYLHNMNTMEEFKKMDKARLLRDAGAEIAQAIEDGSATQDPSLLWQFLLLSFADIKRHKFIHWFAFPAITANPADTVVATRALGGDDTDKLMAACKSFIQQFNKDETLPGVFLVVPASDGSTWTIKALAQWDEVFAGTAGAMLAFVDPSSHASRPGWPLRNLLAWVRAQQAKVQQLQVICFRDAGQLALNNKQRESIVVTINVAAAASADSSIKVSGWERNERQQLGPRVADLSSTMDPERLAESALDLNLQLMRWRAASTINLEKMSSLRVLLVGAGTLGAYAARGLLAWGVRSLTFVDNGRVSFSNPARQPLYEFADSLDGGKPKAEAAAAAIRRIFPRADTQGVQLSIPMPGHAIAEAEMASVQRAVERLDELVASHDAVFLLTDSRESRWLPTMLGALHRKLVMCVALGFDSYVAMRHGMPKAGTEQGDKQLGCYFCNDVVAPADSLSDRTLDQQCTVTRPGLAPIASGTAVELLAAVMQHPLGPLAPALVDDSSSDSVKDDKAVLGTPAHQIRGYLTEFRQHIIAGHAYDMCTACSPKILEAYHEHGFDFLLRACNNTYVEESKPHVGLDNAVPPPGYSYLETLTGLAALHRQTDEMLNDADWFEDSDEDEGEADI